MEKYPILPFSRGKMANVHWQDGISILPHAWKHCNLVALPLLRMRLHDQIVSLESRYINCWKVNVLRTVAARQNLVDYLR